VTDGELEVVGFYLDAVGVGSVGFGFIAEFDDETGVVFLVSDLLSFSLLPF
jgi:hypothetical protein